MTDNIKKPKDVTVAKAKGRPMLTWVGKKPLARVRAYPAQAIERFDATAGKPMPLQEATWTDWSKDLPQGGLLYHGDNKEVLAHLLANGFRGKVKLIYIDPPFDSGADYVRKVQLRGAKGTVVFDGQVLPLTVTIGVAAWAGEGDSLASLLGRADAALYAGKRAGRNCARLDADGLREAA